jgi:NAD(P)-dependent dehydrogenase (short-subunit alcohol dehydrogenase family)
MAYRAVGPEVPQEERTMGDRLAEVYATIDSFQPIRRHGTPRELADVALVLASDESSLVTGSVIVADGAMTAK